jgi:hypothetical protein
MLLEEGLQPRQEMRQHAQMHRVQQVGLEQIGNGAVGKLAEGNGAGVASVGFERRHVLRGILHGILAVVAGGEAVVRGLVITHLIGGALAPDA